MNIKFPLFFTIARQILKFCGLYKPNGQSKYLFHKLSKYYKKMIFEITNFILAGGPVGHSKIW